MPLGRYATLAPEERRLSLAYPLRDPQQVVVLERAVDDTADRGALALQLVDEALTLRAAQGPGLLPLLDAFVGRVGSARPLCFVHHYSPGAPLSSLLDAARRRAEPVDPSIAVALALDTLDGLASLHQRAPGSQPLLHRHLTPRWVIVCDDGRARVGGLTEALRLRWPDPPERPLLLPLLCRLAPEQARGEPPTPATDVHAAGLVLWELLAGKPRFDAATPFDALQRSTFAAPAPPSSARPGLPEALDRAVLSALARRPRDRPSAAQLSQALLEATPPAEPDAVLRWAQTLGAEPFPGPEAYSLVSGADEPSGPQPERPPGGLPYRRPS